MRNLLLTIFIIIVNILFLFGILNLARAFQNASGYPNTKQEETPYDDK